MPMKLANIKKLKYPNESTIKPELDASNLPGITAKEKRSAY